MVLARFLPRNDKFFTYFEAAADNAAEVSALLVEIVKNGDEQAGRIRRVRELEHRGDELTHQIFAALHSTFVTPLDRDDIQRLAGLLDDFVDDLEEVAKRLGLYHLAASPEHARAFARILHEQATMVASAMPLLEDVSRQGVSLRQHAVEIHRLENEADEVLSKALASLYDGVAEIPDLIVAIRWGEIYALLEAATDKAEDVGTMLEGIILKNG